MQNKSSSCRRASDEDALGLECRWAGWTTTRGRSSSVGRPSRRRAAGAKAAASPDRPPTTISFNTTSRRPSFSRCSPLPPPAPRCASRLPASAGARTPRSTPGASTPSTAPGSCVTSLARRCSPHPRPLYIRLADTCCPCANTLMSSVSSSAPEPSRRPPYVALSRSLSASGMPADLLLLGSARSSSSSRSPSPRVPSLRPARAPM
jgi:hypothetical protein